MPEPDHTLDAISTIAWVLQATAHAEVFEVAEGAEGLRQVGNPATGSGVPGNGPARRRKGKAAGGVPETPPQA
jgi:hypothetical protein